MWMKGMILPPSVGIQKWMEKGLRMTPKRGFHRGTCPRHHEEWFSPLDIFFLFTIFLIFFIFCFFDGMGTLASVSIARRRWSHVG